MSKTRPGIGIALGPIALGDAKPTPGLAVKIDLGPIANVDVGAGQNGVGVSANVGGGTVNTNVGVSPKSGVGVGANVGPVNAGVEAGGSGVAVNVGLGNGQTTRPVVGIGIGSPPTNAPVPVPPLGGGGDVIPPSGGNGAPAPIPSTIMMTTTTEFALPTTSNTALNIAQPTAGGFVTGGRGGGGSAGGFGSTTDNGNNPLSIPDGIWGRDSIFSGKYGVAVWASMGAMAILFLAGLLAVSGAARRKRRAQEDAEAAGGGKAFGTGATFKGDAPIGYENGALPGSNTGALVTPPPPALILLAPPPGRKGGKESPAPTVVSNATDDIVYPPTGKVANPTLSLHDMESRFQGLNTLLGQFQRRVAELHPQRRARAIPSAEADTVLRQPPPPRSTCLSPSDTLTPAANLTLIPPSGAASASGSGAPSIPSLKSDASNRSNTYSIYSHYQTSGSDRSRSSVAGGAGAGAASDGDYYDDILDEETLLQGKKKGVVAGTEEQTAEKPEKQAKKNKGKRHILKSAYGHYHKLATVPQEAFDMIDEEQAFTYQNMYLDGKSCKFCGFSGEADANAWLTFLNMLVDHFEEHQRPATRPEEQLILSTLGWRQSVVEDILPDLVFQDGVRLGDNGEEMEKYTDLVWEGKWDHLNQGKMENIVKGIAGDSEDQEDTGFKLPGSGY
ncbi:hypothetical protein HK104_009341 [Borealophlyctis nickersoniae]|nr:hypothetical protein HK104_009341 [Borealophlyctis nickersoniae]